MPIWKSRRIQLSIKAKMIASFAVIMVIIAGISVFNMDQVKQIKEQIAYQNSQSEKRLLALQLKQSANELDSIKSAMIITKKQDMVEEYNPKKEQFYLLIESIAKTASTPEERNWSARLTNTGKEYVASFDQVLEILNKKDISPLEKNMQLESSHNLSQVHKDYIFGLVDEFNKAYTEDAAEAFAMTDLTLEKSTNVALYTLVCVIVLTIIIAYVLIRSLTKPIRSLQLAVQRMASGDLRSKINSSSRDELGELSRSFDHMVDQVRSMLLHTQTIAASLSNHSTSFHRFSGSTAAANAEIIRAIQEISIGADRQANQSEQSASLIAELEQELAVISHYAETIQQKSREAAFNTHTGSTSMEQLQQASQSSESVLGKVYSAMEGLSASTVQIHHIVNTITEISHQTNVLALNAAIEAARAGIHGRGFSVIAEEVRQLSTQTNESSKSIAGIIRSLLGQTKELEAFLGDAKQSFHVQNRKMNDSIAAFQEIRSSMEVLSQQIDQIQQQIASANGKNGMLVESVQVVAAIAQETAAGVEEVNSTSIDQDSAIQRIALQADDILILSQKLFHEIQQFQMGDQETEDSDTEDTSLEDSGNTQGGGVTLTAASEQSGESMSDAAVPVEAEGLDQNNGSSSDEEPDKVKEKEKEEAKKLVTV